MSDEEISETTSRIEALESKLRGFEKYIVGISRDVNPDTSSIEQMLEFEEKFEFAKICWPQFVEVLEDLEEEYSIGGDSNTFSSKGWEEYFIFVEREYIAAGSMLMKICRRQNFTQDYYSRMDRSQFNAPIEFTDLSSVPSPWSSSYVLKHTFNFESRVSVTQCHSTDNTQNGQSAKQSLTETSNETDTTTDPSHPARSRSPVKEKAATNLISNLGPASSNLNTKSDEEPSTIEETSSTNSFSETDMRKLPTTTSEVMAKSSLEASSNDSSSQTLPLGTQPILNTSTTAFSFAMPTTTSTVSSTSSEVMISCSSHDGSSNEQPSQSLSVRTQPVLTASATASLLPTSTTTSTVSSTSSEVMISVSSHDVSSNNQPSQSLSVGTQLFPTASATAFSFPKSTTASSASTTSICATTEASLSPTNTTTNVFSSPIPANANQHPNETKQEETKGNDFSKMLPNYKPNATLSCGTSTSSHPVATTFIPRQAGPLRVGGKWKRVPFRELTKHSIFLLPKSLFKRLRCDYQHRNHIQAGGRYIRSAILSGHGSPEV